MAPGLCRNGAGASRWRNLFERFEVSLDHPARAMVVYHRIDLGGRINPHEAIDMKRPADVYAVAHFG